MDMKTIIHVGYPRTASSLLQLRLFSKHPDIEYPGLRNGNTDWDKYLRQKINSNTDLYFDEDEIRSKIFSIFENKKKRRVISSQGFSTTVTSDRGLVAQRLKLLFGDAEILVCIRNQVDWIESMYHEQLKQGPWRLFTPFKIPGFNPTRSMSLAKWFDYRRTIDDVFPLIRQMDYWPLIKTYKDLFGEKNVHVLLFEDLKLDSERFIDDLCRIIRVDETKLPQNIGKKIVNRRYSAGEMKLMRITQTFPRLSQIAQNQLPESILSCIRCCFNGKGEEKKNKLRPDQIEYIKVLCRTGNQKISSALNRDLTNMGYFV